MMHGFVDYRAKYEELSLNHHFETVDVEMIGYKIDRKVKSSRLQNKLLIYFVIITSHFTPTH
jgi:hypothetical protein